MSLDLPQKFKFVDASAGPVTTNGGVTCDYISLKNASKAWIIAKFTQAVGHATTVQPRRATAVAGTGAADIAHSARIWENEDTAASDALVEGTAATIATASADIKKKLFIIEIDPVAMGNTYDVLGCVVSDSSQVTNLVDVTYIVQSKYGDASELVFITD